MTNTFEASPVSNMIHKERNFNQLFKSSPQSLPHDSISQNFQKTVSFFWNLHRHLKMLSNLRKGNYCEHKTELLFY